MKRAFQKGWKEQAAKTGLAFFILLFVVLVTAAAGEEKLSGTLLLSKPEGRGEILLFRERAGEVWLICGGAENTRLLRLNAATGAVLAEEVFAFPVSRAELYAESLFLLAGKELIRVDAGSLQELSRRELDMDDEPVFFHCGLSGTAWYVTWSHQKAVRVSPWEGPDETLDYPERITFLGADPAGTLFVYGKDTLYVETADGRLTFPGAEKPVALPGQGLWVDAKGVVRRLDGEKTAALFQTEEPGSSSCFYCLDGEDRLILSVSGGVIRRFDLAGQSLGACRTEPGIRGLCAAGVLYEDKNSYYYAPLRFSESAEASPSPEPTTGPEDPPAWLEGDLLLTHAGMTVSAIRELMKPETAEIRSPEGAPVTRGSLATGMTLNHWRVVVLGDCDGTGTVTGRDVKEAVALALQGAKNAPRFRAADLDNDGAITGEDLARLSRMAADGK